MKLNDLNPTTGVSPSKQFVPPDLRPWVIHSAHAARSSGHPDIHRTTSRHKNAFWWHSLAHDTYIKACQACAQSKSSQKLPAGLLEPLPLPQCPWSHISVDFITDLPSCNGYTMILVAINRFSKACSLIPLKGLTTAMEAMLQLVEDGHIPIIRLDMYQDKECPIQPRRHNL